MKLMQSRLTTTAKDTEEAFEKACATPVDKWVERQSPDLYVYRDEDDIKEIQ